MITLTPAELMLGVPSLVFLGGAITFVAVRGMLVDAIEGNQVLAGYDMRSARWLWLRGYRKSPQPGPLELPQMLAIEAEAYEPEAPDDDTERPYLWALAATAVVLAPYAFARHQVGALRAYLRERFGRDDEPQLDLLERFSIAAGPSGRTDEQIAAEVEALTNPRPYVGRHWAADMRHTGAFPVLNIPAQRDGEVSA